jgi:hypothetical protein
VQPLRLAEPGRAPSRLAFQGRPGDGHRPAAPAQLGDPEGDKRSVTELEADEVGASGQVIRHRLSRAGDRKLNHAPVHDGDGAGPPTQPWAGLLPSARWPRARHSGKRCGVSLVEYRRCDPESGSWLLGRRQGTASLLCRQTASFSPAAPGALRPCRPASGTRPVEGRTMKNRRQGPPPTRGSHAAMPEEARCSSAGTERAPPMT